jgi:putative membrane protein
MSADTRTRLEMPQPGLVDPRLVLPTEATRASAVSGVAAAGIVPGEVTAAVEPLDRGDDDAEPALRRAPRSPWRRALWLLAALVGAFLAYDTGAWLADVVREDPVGGGALSALALAFLVALGTATAREVRALRRLREAERFRAELAVALEQDSHRRLEVALAPILAMVGARRPELVRDFRHRSEGQTDCAAVLGQFRGAVLTPLDREARRVVRANAFAMLGATAVCPHPALDVAVVVWRSAAMVRRVAEIYGLRPSGLATIRLARMVMVSAAFAMVADPANQALVDAVGGGLIEKLSGRMAEGSVIGLRGVRLGIRAMDVTRPLPFEPEERRGLVQTLVRA